MTQLTEGLGRGREDDEYHVPDPQKHVFKFKVSHPTVNNGEEHERTVTTGVTTKSKSEMHGHAVNHLTKQGYTIHKHIKEEVEQIDEERISKHKDLGATKDTKHFVKNTTTGEVISPHRTKADAEEGLRAAEADGAEGHKFKIVRAVRESVEDHHAKAEENKRSAAYAGAKGDKFAYHLHMADYHDNLAQWHEGKGRHGTAYVHAQKSEKHHEEAMKHKDVKEEVAANNVGDGNIAGTQGDAGKKAVMTKEPLKRQKLRNFKTFDEEVDKDPCWKNYKMVGMKKKNGKPVPNCVPESTQIEEAAIDAKGHKSSTGGLTQKGVDAYNRANPGHNLQTAVTTPPSKLDPDSKAAKRRKSFCARMSGVDGPMKDENGKPTRKALALRKWNC